jgi:hypothetical protein
MDTKHPGRIPNEKLLKEFNKYIRVDNIEDTSNYVLAGKLREMHYKIIPTTLWEFLSTEFGGL